MYSLINFNLNKCFQNKHFLIDYNMIFSSYLFTSPLHTFSLPIKPKNLQLNRAVYSDRHGMLLTTAKIQRHSQ